jgi:hypothetical protein
VHIPAAPEELTPGFVFANRALGTAWGALRDGDRIVWRCSSLPGHRPHPVPVRARQCASAEQERRAQGGRDVLALLRCPACGVWWDDTPPSSDALVRLLSGRCPACGGPVTWHKVVVLEQGKPGVR